MPNKPVSPNLDVSNILYDHYFAACLNGLLSNTIAWENMSNFEMIEMADRLTKLAIDKRNQK